jgi:uncharacterized protein YhaN
MKIQQLHLKAFGPFTDRTLTFDSDHPGLHIIFGPNETGKSTALRALKALLYGFPERTPDNFLHPNDQLLVGGRLINQEGADISFVRRKRRKSDLLDPDGGPLDESVLAHFLHGIESDVFETLYGIDHEVLVQGGKDILDQKGEVGQALFSAGSGISSLREVLNALDQEAELLFKARGSKQEINRALLEYKELQRQVREAVLPGREWKEAEDALRTTEAELAAAEQQRRDKDARRRQLERLRQALPHLSVRRDLITQIKGMGEVAVLPEDFAARRRSAEKDLHAAAQKRMIGVRRLETLRAHQKGVSFQQQVLDHGKSIEDLYQRLGSHRKALNDRPGLEVSRKGCLYDAAALLKQIPTDLPLEQIETLHLFLGRRKAIQELASTYEALVQRRRELLKRRRTIQQNLKETGAQQEALPQARDGSGLVQAFRLARKSGDMDAMLAEKAHGLQDLKTRCAGNMARLGLWQGETARAGSLSLPLRETIVRFETRFQEYEDQARSVLKEQEKRRYDLVRITAEIEEIRYAGDVPTESDLNQARASRDRGWQLIRREWLDGEDVGVESRAYAGNLLLPEAFEKQVEQADATADRLRREADRVYKFAALRAGKQALEQAVGELKETEKRLAREFESLSKEWEAVWEPCAIQPLPPNEMLTWLSGFEELRFRAGEIEKIERDIRARGTERQTLRDMLLEELKGLGVHRAPPGDTLDPVLILCETVMEDLRRTEEARRKLTEKGEGLRNELEKVGDEQETAEEALKIWHERWAISAAMPASNKAILPEEANDILDRVQRCFARLKESDDLQKRVVGIDRDARDFVETVASVVEQTAPDLKGEPAEQAVMQLQSILKQTLEQKTLLETYTKEIRETEDDMAEADAAIRGAEEQIAVLRRIAGCGEDDDLEEAERLAQEYRQLRKNLAEIESLLLKGAGGLSIAGIEAEAKGVHPDELPGRIDSLSREIEEELGPEIRRLSEQIGKKRELLQQMDGSGRAAEAAEAGEQVLSRVRRLSDRYIRLKVAATVLRQEIERYRSENQDPVLRIASDYFQKFTLGSFSGLRSDEDDQGRPVLVGLRNDTAMVRVEGMSSGTRDQLYLALRLASLQKRLDAGEPMPFIVDDILVNFDDERSRATLKALAELALRIQVIVFTHHQHLVDLADASIDPSLLFKHTLHH